MAWLILTVAGLLEMVWAVALKASAGFTRVTPIAITVVAMAGSVFLLSQAMRVLPLGTAYAVWTGIGAAVTAVVGMIWLGESHAWPRVACIGLIVAGTVGLKLFR